MKIAFLDIESTSLTAESGFIVGFGLMFEDGSWIHEFLKGSVIKGEKEILSKLLDSVSDIDTIVTWYGEGFDIPMIISRCLVHNLDPSIILLKEHIDLCAYAKKVLRLGDYSLDSVAKFFNIPKKIELKGRDMPPIYMEAISGDREALKLIEEHCYDDLNALRKIYEIMKKIVTTLKEKEKL
ncbi:MAG: ribonuclease H-like domain-containing protein [archaeon GB-1867-035]|nr:ribonuclease H-like domain-containing protein [Candidatus Culexmicrobium profundum]